MKVYIYGLYEIVSTGEKAIRYVGKTITPSKRLGQHKCSRSVRSKDSWLRGCLARSSGIGLEILEIVDSNDPEEGNKAERYWIESYSIPILGQKLTNVHFVTS